MNRRKVNKRYQWKETIEINKIKVVRALLRVWWRPTFAKGKGKGMKIRKIIKEKRKKGKKSERKKE